MVQDELTYEMPASAERQAAIIQQYCTGVEERISSAPSRETAQHIVDETCGRLEETCESALLRAFLKKLMQEKLEERWSTRR